MRPRLHQYIPVIDSLQTRLRGARYDNERFRVEIERASEEMIRDREAKELAEEKVESLRKIIADQGAIIDVLVNCFKLKNETLAVFADRISWKASTCSDGETNELVWAAGPYSSPWRFARTALEAKP